MKKGVIMMLMGMLFLHAETVYFGNNLFPGTTAELACDIAGSLVTWYGILLTGKRT